MAALRDSQPLRLDARPARPPAIDGAGFLFGAAILTAARFVPQLISPLAYWLLLAALASAFGADALAWLLQGVRTIELEGDTLTLRRGMRREVRRIQRAEVRSVRSRRRWGGKTIVLRLRGHRGRPRVALADDGFDRQAFAALAERLAAWER